MNVSVQPFCYNCDIYEWKQPEDSSIIKKCAKCEFVNYCSSQCEEEHWENIHKHHCKYLGKEEVLEKSIHEKEDCPACQEELSTGEIEIKDVHWSLIMHQQ